MFTGSVQTSRAGVDYYIGHIYQVVEIFGAILKFCEWKNIEISLKGQISKTA